MVHTTRKRLSLLNKPEKLVKPRVKDNCPWFFWRVRQTVYVMLLNAPNEIIEIMVTCEI